MVKEILPRDWDQTGAGEEPPRHSAYFPLTENQFRFETNLVYAKHTKNPSRHMEIIVPSSILILKVVNRS